MRQPSHAVIAPAKIGRYLLRLLEEDDNSQFLALAGYSAADPVRPNTAPSTGFAADCAGQTVANCGSGPSG